MTEDQKQIYAPVVTQLVEDLFAPPCRSTAPDHSITTCPQCVHAWDALVRYAKFRRSAIEADGNTPR